MAAIKFLIPPKFKGKLTNIRVRFYNGRKFDISAQTNILINPTYWSNKSGKVRQRAEFTEAGEYQKKLDDLKDAILKDYKDKPDKSNINKEWLIKAIDKFNDPTKYLQDSSLFGFVDHFIKNSDKRINSNTGNLVSKRTKDEYSITFNLLKEYAIEYGEPDFIDIDFEFYERFVDLLRKKGDLKRKKGLANNTIGKKIKTLKIFLNDAFEKGINPYTKYKSKNFKVISEESDNIYLTKEEINTLYNFDLSDKKSLERVRDLFVIGCWTGLRFGDLEQITLDKIKDDFIELRQKKTGNKVHIPIHSTVKEILNKYNGILPKPISNQKYNEYLKEAAKLAGIDAPFFKTISRKGIKTEKKYLKYELISSHTARRSFCTNAYKDDIPTMAIMAVSGHKTEKDFLRYIKADSKVHAQKVLDVWKSQQSFLKVAK